ncbi:hypothetical protein QEH56_10050 [Pelagicoccus enzymogenes]|uniref:hypothetical protein n=1 Tax=Pelagicoccus enzymogenes TaxID=2773457 RepID=UPI00280E7CF8|nr:hypothetical protein [Pelagicoccus enzymogenes]MDQ8198491.1 hypothetical protein [Pelagicoccus enzymogenes]
MIASDVFGIKKDVSKYSYFDRGDMDASFRKYLKRDKHIAIKGESKCGKSWLRQQNLPDALVVQCRLDKDKNDIYVDALSQLGVSFEVTSSSSGKVAGKVSATGEFGANLLAKIGFKTELSAEGAGGREFSKVGGDITDLRYVADLLRGSERRLVIEDFHYLRKEERKAFAYDLKALWDYGLYVVIIGIWSENNLLPYLNSDLSGRMYELELTWSPDDLKSVIEKGGRKLNVEFNADVISKLIDAAFGNVGIMQELVLDTLERSGIEESKFKKQNCCDPSKVTDASMFYSEQLNPIYRTLAKRISSGIRNKKNSTDAYMHMLVVLLSEEDLALINGVHIDVLYEKVRSREPRINKGNLKKALSKLEELQVDQDGRGLVFSFNDADEVHVVDRQLLLYRSHMTVNWPWEDESY